ncbi:AraC family transcriptional regulator [Pseudomonas sp. StFLB209]|uniref:AraC family transcriptional regulator n=1 Tax=Pseudomonas sp. StFLB209 TaxID=1028989 RepID=UPI0004F6EEDA|nr:helix-turn-helix transcriptional regulator [Pseudomonas sp. StFLB209]BAP44895.1 AraC family transcriptional regulator [Pseudomonas sp. StFLB209]
MLRPQEQFVAQIDAGAWMIISSATDYPENWLIAPHQHNKHQLIYAIEGVMVVHSADRQWIVPPSRGIWMPCGQIHAIRCVGAVKMRSVFVQPHCAPDLPQQTRAVSISPLLSELIKASVGLDGIYPDDSRQARLLRLIVDELVVLPTLPLELRQPADPRLQLICRTLQHNPADHSTMTDWARHLQVDEKTLQRLFRKDTGMTFGQWRQQARLLMALEKIACGERIIEVALQLGYDSPSAFTSMFKKQFGMPPSGFFR